MVTWLWHWESRGVIWFLDYDTESPDYDTESPDYDTESPDYDTERPEDYDPERLGEWSGSETMTLRVQGSDLVPRLWHWETRVVIWFPDYDTERPGEWSGSLTILKLWLTLRDQGSYPWIWHWESRGVIWWQKIASISSTLAGNIPVITS